MTTVSEAGVNIWAFAGKLAHELWGKSDVSKSEFQAITSSRFSDVMCESLSVRVHDLSHEKS